MSIKSPPGFIFYINCCKARGEGGGGGGVGGVVEVVEKRVLGFFFLQSTPPNVTH